MSARRRISVMPLANTKVSIQIVHMLGIVTNSLAKKKYLNSKYSSIQKFTARLSS